jgi:hypothetical protein
MCFKSGTSFRLALYFLAYCDDQSQEFNDKARVSRLIAESPPAWLTVGLSTHNFLSFVATSRNEKLLVCFITCRIAK